MHFQTWHDKAGNATNITDGNLTFPNLNSGVDPNNGATGNNIADLFQTNLIMPEPTVFLNRNLGPVSIIRPTPSTQKVIQNKVCYPAAQALTGSQVKAEMLSTEDTT
jgi:hypothetical protein